MHEETFIKRIERLIRGVVWKVSPQFRQDITSDLWEHVLKNQKNLENKNDNFLFFVLRNKCVNLNRKEIKYRDNRTPIDKHVFETVSLDQTLFLMDQQQLLSAALYTIKQEDKKCRKLICTTIQKICEGERYPVKKAQKIHHMKTQTLYRILKRIRKKYGANKTNDKGKVYSVRTLEQFEEQLYIRPGTLST